MLRAVLAVELNRLLNQGNGLFGTSCNRERARCFLFVIRAGLGVGESGRQELRRTVASPVDPSEECPAPSLLLAVEVNRHCSLNSSTADRAQRVSRGPYL